VTAAITGQPMPGEPSTSTQSAPCSTASITACCRNSLTSLPEFSSPGESRAWSSGPIRVSARYQLPDWQSTMWIASAGHW
jgi:hypothetical protein